MDEQTCGRDSFVEEFREIFNMFDTNGDGSISTRELKTIMRSLGQDPSETELRDMVKGVDADSSGEVEFDEFVKLIAKKMQKVDLEEEIMDAFKVFDTDGNGNISKAELRNAMTSLGKKFREPELDELFQLADINGDGQINYKEFVRIISPTGCMGSD
ncbi:neo-calmodulin-like [Dreissena polymorpha]|uniref:EF-hand domain-containing protein n=1 Tax=Dreissena polymorpha TaxID=45954 RepID=A0A9D4JX69_DREPO|nr:neo-calmodulin-like [Dreissena polymorpha]KAH3828050.1 hypothetical protein DPMN_129999 [Dreissena polymorpha]